MCALERGKLASFWSAEVSNRTDGAVKLKMAPDVALTMQNACFVVTTMQASSQKHGRGTATAALRLRAADGGGGGAVLCTFNVRRGEQQQKQQCVLGLTLREDMVLCLETTGNVGTSECSVHVSGLLHDPNSPATAKTVLVETARSGCGSRRADDYGDSEAEHNSADATNDDWREAGYPLDFGDTGTAPTATAWAPPSNSRQVPPASAAAAAAGRTEAAKRPAYPQFAAQPPEVASKRQQQPDASPPATPPIMRDAGGDIARSLHLPAQQLGAALPLLARACPSLLPRLLQLKQLFWAFSRTCYSNRSSSSTSSAAKGAKANAHPSHEMGTRLLDFVGAVHVLQALKLGPGAPGQRGGLLRLLFMRSARGDAALPRAAGDARPEQRANQQPRLVGLCGFLSFMCEVTVVRGTAGGSAALCRGDFSTFSPRQLGRDCSALGTPQLWCAMEELAECFVVPFLAQYRGSGHWQQERRTAVVQADKPTPVAEQALLTKCLNSEWKSALAQHSAGDKAVARRARQHMSQAKTRLGLY